MMYNWIRSFGFTGIVIATKADKISRGNWQKHIKIIKDKLNIQDAGLIIPYSSQNKTNREDVWRVISRELGLNN